MPQKSYNKESKLFLLVFGKKINRDAQKGGNKKENTYQDGKSEGAKD